MTLEKHLSISVCVWMGSWSLFQYGVSYPSHVRGPFPDMSWPGLTGWKRGKDKAIQQLCQQHIQYVQYIKQDANTGTVEMSEKQ